MHIPEAKALALRTMRRYGLTEAGWTLKFYHNTDHVLGYTQHSTKVIGLHRLGTFLNDEAQVLDTILHEVAHVLTGPVGHGPEWQAKAVELGARPQPCVAPEYIMPPRRHR